MNQEEKIQLAQTLNSQLDEVVNMRNTLFWGEAEIWAGLKRDNVFKYVFGGDIQSDTLKYWKTFVAEKGQPLSTVEFRIALYEKWVKELGFKIKDLEGIHVIKLQFATKFAKDKKTAKAIIQFARHVPLMTFKEELTELKEVTAENISSIKFR